MKSEKWKVRGNKQGGDFSLLTSHFLLFLLPPLLAVLIFAPTISHPLMYDTLLHTQLADGQTLFSVFLPDERFGFYRPLVFLPIVLFQNILGLYSTLFESQPNVFGQIPAWLLHGINLLTHALNALLLTRLVWRISQQKWRSFTAGLLFASFPFAYQALAIYGNNPYLTVSFFLLLGLNLVVSGQLSVTSDQWQPLPTGHWSLVTIFILGVLVHETMVLLIPLVAFTSLITAYRPPPTDHRAPFTLLRSLFTRHWPLYTACAIYLVIYIFLPRGGGPGVSPGRNLLGPKILLFLQTAAWPFVGLLHRFLDGRMAILIGFALFLGAAGYRVWQSGSLRQLPSLWVGIAWVLLASILIGVTLPTYYIEDGARLLYPGAAGVAMVWAVLISPKDGPAFKNLNRLLNTALIMALVIAGAWFNRRMINLYEMGSEPVGAIGEALADERADDDLILINLPQWVAWPQQLFPAGTEFAPVMGSHLFAVELVRANFGPTPGVTVLDVPENLPQTPYTFGVYKLGSVGEYKPAYTKDEPKFDPTIQVVATDYGPETPTGRWVGTITLVNSGQIILYDWETDSFGFEQPTACRLPDGSVQVSSTLWPKVQPAGTTSLFVQALAANGRLIAQNDGPPLGVSPQRLLLQPSMRVEDRRILAVENARNNEDGDMQAAEVLIGVYDFSTGEREQAIDSDGEQLADNGFRVEVSGDCTAAVGR